MKEKGESSALQIAQELSDNLKSLEGIKDRDEFIEKVKQDFVAMRLKTSNKVEEARLLVLERLMHALEDKNLPVTAMLKILEVLNKGGSDDLKSLLSEGDSINIMNGTQIAGSLPQVEEMKHINSASSNNAMKQIGQTFEALEAISTSVDTKKLQDLKSVVDAEFQEVKNERPDKE